jgi:glutathione S-transferase
MTVRKIYGVTVSPFVRKVRLVLAVKQLDYELDPVIPMAAPDDYVSKSPLGKIPCYEDESVVLPDSSVISAYLERIAPSPRLYPEDPALFGRALWFEEYSDTRLFDEVTPVFNEKFLNERIYKQPADEKIVTEQIEHRLPLVYDYLEGQIEDPVAIVGSSLSIADLSLVAHLATLVQLDIEIDADRWPRLTGYLDHQLKHPVVGQLLEEERAAIAAMT